MIILPILTTISVLRGWENVRFEPSERVQESWSVTVFMDNCGPKEASSKPRF